MKEKEIRSDKVLKKYQEYVDLDFKRFLRNKNKNFKNINYKLWGSNNVVKLFSKKNFDYYECQDLGTIFANPRPKPSVLKKFYSNSKSNEFWYKEFYLPKLKNRILKSIVPKVNHLTKNFENYKNKKILDVGCGAGFFLTELKKKWKYSKLYGLEPSLTMSKEVLKKDIKVFCNTIERFKKNNYFDVVCCFELFEHMYDPFLFLKKINKLLKKNGIIYFSTLNGKGFDIELLKQNSSAIYPPYHLNFFNPISVKKILELSGFRQVKVETPGELDFDIVSKNINNIENNVSKLIFNELLKKFKEGDKIKLQKIIRKKNMSSHMLISAKK